MNKIECTTALASSNSVLEISPVFDSIYSAQSSVVVAGHYCLANHMRALSYEGSAEEMSFELGARLVAVENQQHRRSQLVLWVNDIGINTQERERVRSGYRLPENYQCILKKAGLDEKYLTVMFESAMRNKASSLLRKLYKRHPYLFERVAADSPDLVRCISSGVCEAELPSVNAAYVVAGPDGERLVVKDGPNPKCNLILATFFDELRKNFSPGLLINIFNDIYIYRLSLGIHVSKTILHNPTPFHNVFCDGEHIFLDSS